MAAILLNVPGTPSSAVSCLDGNPMAKQGRAGVALLMTTVASFVGASTGIILMMLFSPIIVAYALEFGSPEFFSLMFMGIIAASMVSHGSPVKSLAMVVLGILLGLVGTDVNTATERFDFGRLELSEGISLIALGMGIFGVAEVIASVRTTHAALIDPKSITFRSMIPTKDDLRRSWAPVLRGTGIGSFIGALPGAGPAIATFMSYALEKRISREPERFGNGAIEGLVSAEASNNAADQTAFIPTMTLGIPGSVTMAIMLGALMIQGITPGPSLIAERPELFWGLVMSFWIGNVNLVLLNIPLIGIWVRLLTVPYQYLYPAVLMFICIGVYSVGNSSFDVWAVVVFGAIGYGLRLLEMPAAPILLGFILGPMMEENFRRSMLLSRGSFEIFYNRPISAVLVAASACLLIWGVWGEIKLSRSRSMADRA